MSGMEPLKLPYTTAWLAGVGGRIKLRPDDFRVDELPLYPLSGQGTHAFFRVLKSGVPTPVAVHRIARHMGVQPGDIGFAGLKDSQALTSQWMSLEFADAGRLERFRDSQVSICDVTWHGNKLRPGHLKANRFAIKIRDVGQAELPAAKAILDVLTARGTPNYFGQQRFGARGDTGLLGAAMVRSDIEEFVRIFLGRPMATDPPDCRAARQAFDAADFSQALRRWPRHYVDQRKALTAYMRRRDGRAALGRIDKRFKRLFVSAFQSEIFNRVLAERIGSFDTVLAGDLAQKTDSGGIFTVEDLATDQPRAKRFEISPTGPIVGYRCNFAQGEPGRLERLTLEQFGIGKEAFERVDRMKVKGTRRPLRFPLSEPAISASADRHGQFIELAFSAPSGCYATVVLREIMKTETTVDGNTDTTNEESDADSENDE
ncbi:MAG: tRNA pseudouridine(13) synthase TruD [Planctomycetes bacterium]|nr:tRNA pseudouridine(13) synthase TruD [Planctomycetota bacterium]